jgi:KamA family protein
MLRWERELKRSVTTVDQLKKHFKINKREEELLRKVVEIHPMRITPYYLSLMDKHDKKDPIRKMEVPSVHELDMSGLYDQSGEKENTKSVGLQHKYRQTAVILSTNKCGAYCRFCFRKRLVGLKEDEILKRFNKAIKYIKEHKEVNNVLITGGDPLSLKTHMIEKFLKLLMPIKHLDFVRFGSRVPVTFPQRILWDDSLPRVLKKYSKKEKRVYVVTHFNHPREITKESTEACNRIIKSNVIMNNQTVLMAGVNDNAKILGTLQNDLVRIGVNPYYVFQCRPVKRVKKYFQVPLMEGIDIVEDAKKICNGHSKRFNFIMAHKTGKIEIIEKRGGRMYFKYHQAKNPRNIGRFFSRKMGKRTTWLS